MKILRRHLRAVVFVLGVIAPGSSASSVLAQEFVESVRSTPKDTTPYVREAVPEDYAPPGTAEREAISPLPGIFIVDVVVNNTDHNLTNTDTRNDGETSIAVNSADPDDIVITAFSGGWGANAPVWHTLNGGVTWTRRFTIPNPPGIASGPGGCPCDQTVDYGRGDLLSGAFLDVSPGEPVGSSFHDVYSGTTSDPANSGAWAWLAPGGATQQTNINNPGSFGGADQPWLLVNRDVTNAAQDNVYVAYDDFNTDGIDRAHMRIAVSLGSNPPNFTRDAQAGGSVGLVNPGHRLAVDPQTGFVYSLFQRCLVNCETFAANPKTIDYILNRSTDSGQSWNLNGSATGIVVATADSTQPRPKFGTVNALHGGVLHAAVDPSTGDVYYVYGNRDAVTGNNRLAIRRIVDDRAGGVTVGPESFVTGQVQAAIPSVAVTQGGTVGVFYYTFDGFSSDGFPIFTAHLALSDDLAVIFTDLQLLTFLSSAKDCNIDPSFCSPGADFNRQRVFGDYMQMKALGDCFYGAFTGNGVPFGRPFANHDPIFFKTCLGAFNLTVAKEGTGSGTVVSSPAGIDCGSDCQESYVNVPLVTLTATPLGNSLFAGWSGGRCTGRGVCTLPSDADTTVTATFVAPLTLSALTLPNGEVGVPYGDSLVTGGLSPYTLILKKGTLPAGLSFNAADGTLGGAPTSSALKGKSFTAQISDQLGSPVTGAFKITILAALNITTKTLKSGTHGKSYKTPLHASGGKTPYSWSELTGNLTGTGLVLNSSTGAITGTPLAAGTIDLTLEVTDALGGQVQKRFTLTIK